MPAGIAVQFAGLPQNGDQNAKRRRRQNEGDEQRRADHAEQVEHADEADGESEAGEPRQCAKAQFGPPDLVSFELEPRLEKQEDEAEFREELIVLSLFDQSHHAGADRHANNELAPDHGH